MATATGKNEKLQAALATRIQSGTVSKGEFASVLDGFKKEIGAALPTHLKNNAERYARQCLALFSQSPKLQQCRPVTILSALMTASALGLDLSPQLGQCYILPYDNKKRIGNEWTTIPEAQFQLGYKGAISLALRSDRVARIAADVVCEKDFFEYSKGLTPKLEHIESEEEDRGEITHVYAVANFTNGGYAFEVWPVNKVRAHARKFSKSYLFQGKENPSSPWAKDFESMAKKTLILAIWKYLPVSTEIMTAAQHDESVKRDLSEIHTEGDVINILPVHAEDESDAPEAEAPPALPAPAAEVKAKGKTVEAKAEATQAGWPPNPGDRALFEDLDGSPMPGSNG